MIDLHNHTLLSDGELIPAELVRRAIVGGYRVLGLSDHSDLATLPAQLPMLRAAARAENENRRILVLAGTELTHVPPGQIAEAVKIARELGAQYVIVHGETISEPVERGTNRAAILAGVDILAHPGMIAEEDARLAAERGVMLEISGRRGHSLTNGRVAQLAARYGAGMIFGSDSHMVGDQPTRDFAETICLGAGIGQAEAAEMFLRAERFAKGLGKPM